MDEAGSRNPAEDFRHLVTLHGHFKYRKNPTSGALRDWMKQNISNNRSIDTVPWCQGESLHCSTLRARCKIWVARCDLLQATWNSKSWWLEWLYTVLYGMRTYVHTYIRTYVHTCMHACMHACVRACVRAWGVKLQRLWREAFQSQT